MEQTGQLLARVKRACRSIDHPEANCTTAADARLAVILSDCDRQTAVRCGNQLLATVRGWNHSELHHPRPVTISIGVVAASLLAKNFPAHELADAADRCLFAGRACGGNCLKSIEVC